MSSVVVVVIGPGQIGRRSRGGSGVGMVDASSREAVQALVETATGLGEVTGVIHAAGVPVSPTR